jgi:polysaccharide biosynthesis transport protein
MAHIEEIKKRQRALRLEGLTTLNPSVARLGVQMQELDREKSSLETQFPVLKNYISVVQRSGAGGVTNGVRLDLESELASINLLERTILSDDAVLDGLMKETFRLMEIEPKLTELERRRDAAKRDYEHVMTLVEKAKSDANSTGGAVQMSIIQEPTPPKLDVKKFLKLVGVAFGGCVGLGLGLAFLMDMVLDRSIRRPSQIIRGLRLPVVLTIPDANREESGLFFTRRRNGNMKVMRRDKRDDSDKMANAVAPWSPDNQLQSHIEGLRERVITHFEVKDLEHSPKLVAVTACMDGAGVTTLASGLAAALSRTGNGSALLVDMNAGEGVTHSFYKGKPGYGPSESIETEMADANGEINMSLEKVTGGGTRRSRLAGILPPSFNEHSPKLKADAYDYVVFDMTAISPASVTPRLSGHMDLVLFVIESEKTKDHTARHAAELMRESRANVMAILNKYHNPVPGWLAHD